MIAERELHEVDSRSNHGITVTLYVVAGESDLLVRLIDEPRDYEHEFRVEPAFAGDAFKHPYAYIGETH